MKNTLQCKNCNTENPLYKLTCKKCSGYLREKIFNIDMWDTLIKLIETPSIAFIRIIQSEHKNFLIFIILFSAIKLSINSVYLSLLISRDNHFIKSIVLVYGVNLGILLIALFTVSLILYFLMKNKKNQTRFWDDFSITTYSLIPYILGLMLLFPIELILFGYTVFSVNPHPFLIKATLAYIMLGFEVLFFLWSAFLFFKAIKTQNQSVSTSAALMVLFNLIIYGSLYLTSKYFFVYEL